MALKEQLQNDMKAALLGGNRFEADIIRNLKAAILNEEVAVGKRDEGLADSDIELVIVREVKKRRESIALYEQNDRQDLADNEKKELVVLERYLPEQMGDDDILAVVNEVIAELGDVSMQQMGQVIGAVKSRVGTSADGAAVARIVKEQLSK